MDRIAIKMSEHKMELVQLDQRYGDGDLGIYMEAGFRAAADFMKESDLTDLGRLFNKTADVFNETAPSSLGTIMSFIMKGMARSLKGKEGSCSVKELGEALQAGLANVSAKTGSAVNQKTILDALTPGADTLVEKCDAEDVLLLAAKAAREGSEKTREMKAVWGRAAYFGEQTIGHVDGGSVAGALIFEAIAKL